MLDRIVDLFREHRRWFVLTGAGVSTSSGIPDYRDERGEWKRPQPVNYAEFMRRPEVRQRYWARAMLGWPSFRAATTGEAHHALAELEQSGHIDCVVTQNVDRLHQRAGSREVVDLHGRLDEVVCQGCGARTSREAVQQELELANPAFARMRAETAPDGDADLSGVDFSLFSVPGCFACGGILKPDVVFFGERVPPDRVDDSFRRLEATDAVLVAGSSLMVWSGFRFARAAAEAGRPVVAINRGRTRADDLLACKWEEDCGAALAALVRGLD